jgi:hypothetical protein
MNTPYVRIPGPSAPLGGTDLRDGRGAAGRVRSTWLVLRPDDEAPGALPPVSQGATWWRFLRLPGHGAKQIRASLFARILRGR